MKRAIAVCASLFALGMGVAFAGDVPPRRWPPAYTPKPRPLVWTGFYADVVNGRWEANKGGAKSRVGSDRKLWFVGASVGAGSGLSSYLSFLPDDLRAVSGLLISEHASAPGEAATPHFFLTLRACANSGLFTASECDDAFAEAQKAARDRAPVFSSSALCVASFQLCTQRLGAASLFSPKPAGVELTGQPYAVLATPVLVAAQWNERVRLPSVSRIYVMRVTPVAITAKEELLKALRLGDFDSK